MHRVLAVASNTVKQILRLKIALVFAVLLVLIIAITRYASVGSLTVLTVMLFVLLTLSLTGVLASIYILYGVLAWIIIVNAHRPNIQRLRQGTERRLSFTKTSPTPSA